MRKLTLSLEPEVIDLAKRLAGEQGISVSEMFSHFIRLAAKSDRPPKTAVKTRLATGLVKIPKSKTDRQLIEEALTEKYLR